MPLVKGFIHIFLFLRYDLDNYHDGDDTENTDQNNVIMSILQLLLPSSVRTSNTEDVEIHKVQCGACGTYPIKRDRYKCLNCERLDMCGRCFARRKEPRHHSSGHAFVHFEVPGELLGRSVNENEVTFAGLKTLYADENHESIYCDGCDSHPIKGLRFKCNSCSDYDLCQQCVDNSVTTKAHKLTHSLIVVSRRTIQQIPADDIQVDQELGRGIFGEYFFQIYLIIF